MHEVESGFSMVCDAKNGLLAASDDRGRILFEEPTRIDGAAVTMLDRVPVPPTPRCIRSGEIGLRGQTLQLCPLSG